MGEYPVGGSVLTLTNLMDQMDFRALPDDEQLRYLDALDELITDLNERALQLQASIAVAEWRAQVHDVLGGVSA